MYKKILLHFDWNLESNLCDAFIKLASDNVFKELTITCLFSSGFNNGNRLRIVAGKKYIFIGCSMGLSYLCIHQINLANY